MGDKAQFLAYFPGIQSAIKIHGQGDGMRVQFEIPENQVAAAIDLLAWRNRVLKVTIEPAEVESSDDTRKDKKTHF